jgi:hypothetical protein
MGKSASFHASIPAILTHNIPEELKFLSSNSVNTAMIIPQKFLSLRFDTKNDRSKSGSFRIRNPILIAWVKASRPTPFEQTTPNPVITTPPHLTIFKIIKIVSRLVNIFLLCACF